jgi:hypothetical protein
VASGTGRILPPSARPSPFFQTATPVLVQCRCGTRIPPGGTVFGVTVVSPYSEDLFRDQVFCSIKCIQAFCLESLEILDVLDTPASKATVTDLHELYRGVAETMATILGA